MQMKKVIQVGIGGMGDAWLRTVLASADVEFAALVEIEESIARKQTEKYDIDPGLIFRSLGDALATVRADGVIDITPPAFHREVSLAALEAGIPVLSEKPLADSMASAQAIVRKADETGVLHMVAQNYRYSPPVQTLRKVLASGAMGPVGSVAVEFFKGPHFGGFRDKMPYPLIIDMAIHHFDMMRFLLGSDPVSMYGRSWNPAWSWYSGDASAALMLEFANGATVSYDGSWCSTGKETPWNANWRFECENGIVLLREDEVFTQLRTDTLVDCGAYRQYENRDLERVPAVDMEHLAQSYLLHEFLEALTTGRTPATTCQDNIKSLAIVFDAIRSFETGHTVQSSEMTISSFTD
jgi:predicted dehydrogenase